MTERATTVPATPRSADRALSVLDLLERRGHGLPTMVIAKHCGIPKSSAHQLLNAMRDRGFVRYDATAHTWSVGDRAREIGAEAPTIPIAMRVLDSFDRRFTVQTVSQIARRTGLDQDRVEQAVSVMAAEGLLMRSPGGACSLGLRIVQFAARLEPIELLRSVALPLLSELRDATSETANLLILDGQQVVYLDQMESPRALRHSGWAGRVIPLAGTASGAALGGDHEVHILADAVEAGITTVACGIPGFDHPRAAISITAPSFRLGSAKLKVVKGLVETTATRIGTILSSSLAVPHSPVDPAG